MSYGNKSIDDWADDIHHWAVGKGWWEEERNFGEMVALMHSELSEALEAWRDPEKGDEPSYLVPGPEGVLKPEGWATELADCVIRIMDTCAAKGVSLETMIRAKMEYNDRRPYRHGGKRA